MIECCGQTEYDIDVFTVLFVVRDINLVWLQIGVVTIWCGHNLMWFERVCQCVSEVCFTCTSCGETKNLMWL